MKQTAKLLMTLVMSYTFLFSQFCYANTSINAVIESYEMIEWQKNVT